MKNNKKTIEPQYNSLIEDNNDIGPVKLGVMTSHLWRTDPRHLGFLLSRYKFVAKMFSGLDDVLEVGCGDGFGAKVLLQEVKRVHCVDFDPLFIENCKKERKETGLTFDVADLTKKLVFPRRDAVYSLDVLEHISKSEEDLFLRNIVNSLKSSGICIIGMPSLESQTYASKWSKEGHVNCKSGKELKLFMEKYFEHVFIFSMNDEVVHTGYYPMAHYLLALAVTPKKL